MLAESSSRTSVCQYRGTDFEQKIVPDADCGFAACSILASGSKLPCDVVHVLMFTRWCLICLFESSRQKPTFGVVWLHDPISWLSARSNVSVGVWKSFGKLTVNKHTPLKSVPSGGRKLSAYANITVSGVDILFCF